MFEIEDSVLELHHATATSVSNAGEGGVAKIWTGTFRVFDSKLSSNAAMSGAAIDGDRAEINRSIINNASTGVGGAIRAYTFEATCVRFENNTSQDRGGSIFMVQDATILYSSFIGNTASFEGNHIYAQGWNIHAQQNYWSTTPIVPNDITSTVDVSLPLSNDPTLNYSIGDYYNPSSPCTMASPVSFPMTSPTATPSPSLTPSPTLTPTSIPSYTPTASATPESFYYYDFRLQQYPWVEDPGRPAQVPVGYRAYSNWVAGVGYEPSNIFYGNFSGSNRYIRGSQLEFQFSEPLPIDRIWIRAVGVYGSDKHLQLQRASDGQWVGTMNFNHSWTINVEWTVPGNGSGSLAASQGATEYYTAARYLYAQASGSSNYPIGHVAESLTIYLRSPEYPFPTPTPTETYTPTPTPTATPAICEPALMMMSSLEEDCITPTPTATMTPINTYTVEYDFREVRKDLRRFHRLE